MQAKIDQVRAQASVSKEHAEFDRIQTMLVSALKSVHPIYTDRIRTSPVKTWSTDLAPHLALIKARDDSLMAQKIPVLEALCLPDIWKLTSLSAQSRQNIWGYLDLLAGMAHDLCGVNNEEALLKDTLETLPPLMRNFFTALDPKLITGIREPGGFQNACESMYGVIQSQSQTQRQQLAKELFGVLGKVANLSDV